MSVAFTTSLKAGRDLLCRATSIGDVIYAVGTGAHVNTNMLVASDHLAEVERIAQVIWHWH